MPNYNDHGEVISLLEDAQDSDIDLREIAREMHHFLDKRDGQWEPEVWNKFKRFGRPRYSFDMCNPIVDQIAGEMEQADFDIKCKPADGDASDENAKVLDGMIRNIENISNAGHVFNAAGRAMITSGIDGWRVTQEYGDGDCFDQDLFIRKISNFVDRVWIDPASEMQNHSDARYGFVLQSMPLAEYKKMWPEGAASSVSDGRESEVYTHKQSDVVMVGEILYIKEVERELVLMSNNKVYEADEKLDKVLDELAQQGVSEVKRRTRPKKICYSRFFDNNGFLEDESETVFDSVPIIVSYGNFKISENKRIYRGCIERSIDQQRVLNYALSRDIEQGALAPRDKLFMTPKQAEGFTGTLKTLNTNSDPVQFYNMDSEAPPPYRPTSATPNAGLQTTAANMRDMIQQSSGISPVAKGDNPGLQSGVAIDQLQRKTDTQTIKWFTSQEVAIQRTGDILIKAIPKVYDTARKVRILGEDGATSMVMLNENVFDQQSGEMVKLNDLSAGKYDVVCSSGPSFVSRQQETVAAINELAALDPLIMEQGRDIFLNSIPSPGIDLIADRVRGQMLTSGLIPEDQMTDKEKEKLSMQSQQDQGPTPEQMIGQAEMIRAKTESEQAVFDRQEAVAMHDIKMEEVNLKRQKLQQDGIKIRADFESKQETDLDRADKITDIQLKNAQTLKVMADARKVAGETEDEAMQRVIMDLPTEQIIGMLQ